MLAVTAYSRHYDTEVAVDQCIASLGGVSPTLLILFCGGKHRGETVLGRLRAAFGGIPIVGGAAAGVIDRTGVGYSGLEIGVVALTDPAITPSVHVSADLAEDETAAGEALGGEVARVAGPDAVVMLFYDSVAVLEPLRLHHGSSIVGGFHAGLGRSTVRLIGAGLLTDMNLSDSWLIDGATIRRHRAVALVFPPSVSVETVVLHGCRPISTFMEITRIDGAQVYELDGQPALEVIETMLGISLGSAAALDLSLMATLGEKQGDPFAPYDENAYVNRLILNSDREAGSVTLFEPDFRVGTQVQIMARDNALMLDSVRNGVVAANRVLAEGNFFLSLYFDCAGRASAYSGAEVEEAELLVRTLHPSTALMGFYSGVEIAPFEGYSRPLDWTGLLAMFQTRL